MSLKKYINNLYFSYLLKTNSLKVSSWNSKRDHMAGISYNHNYPGRMIVRFVSWIRTNPLIKGYFFRLPFDTVSPKIYSAVLTGWRWRTQTIHNQKKSHTFWDWQVLPVDSIQRSLVLRFQRLRPAVTPRKRNTTATPIKKPRLYCAPLLYTS